MCAEGLTRILVFLLNFGFLLLGLALAGVGVNNSIHFINYNEAFPTEYDALQIIPILAVILGSIIIFISFLGCCGTCKSSSCMLTTYSSILLTLFLLQIALGVFAFIQINDNASLKKSISNHMTELFKHYKEDPNVASVVDLIQIQFKCCGTSSPLSWVTSGMMPPSSCYDNENKILPIHPQGCSEFMYEFIKGSIKYMAIGVMIISAIEVIGAVLGLCLSNSIKAEKRRRNYI